MYAEMTEVRTDFTQFFLLRVDERLLSDPTEREKTLAIFSMKYPEQPTVLLAYEQGRIEPPHVFGPPELERALLGVKQSDFNWIPIEIDRKTRQITRPHW
jgi:hypothetical protein